MVGAAQNSHNARLRDDEHLVCCDDVILQIPVLSDPDNPLQTENRASGGYPWPARAISRQASRFMLLEKGAKAEISEIFQRYHISPQVQFSTWDDYAIMSMVENGLGISLL